MVGQGVLRECLLDPSIEAVQTVGRSATGAHHLKLQEFVQPDLFHYSGIEARLKGYHACFFCLGVASAGMSEQQYKNLTYTLTLAAAETLSRLNPAMTFVYVSGAGTDSSEQGRVMWARVKGKTENALLRLPFKAAYMFRPGGNSAGARGALQDNCVPGRLRIGQTRTSLAPPPISAIYPDDRRNRPRDDSRGKARRIEESFGELGHWRLREIAGLQQIDLKAYALA